MGRAGKVGNVGEVDEVGDVVNVMAGTLEYHGIGGRPRSFGCRSMCFMAGSRTLDILALGGGGPE